MNQEQYIEKIEALTQRQERAASLVAKALGYTEKLPPAIQHKKRNGEIKRLMAKQILKSKSKSK